MKGLAIKQNSVFVLAMVAQPFAMVGNENDQSPVIDVATLELFQKAPTIASEAAISPS